MSRSPIGAGSLPARLLGLALYAIISLITVASGMPARAGEPASVTATSPNDVSNPDGPTKVKVGMYITQLLDFDMSKRSYYATYWLWYLHDNEKYDPRTTIEVTNAKSDAVKFATLDTSRQIRWHQEKHSSVLSEGWDIQKFPFDRQKLHITIEDGQSDASQIQFVADSRNSSIDPALRVPGWTIENFDLAASDVSYDTSYGDPDLSSGSVYSRVVATITIKRDGLRLLCSLFVGFGVAFLLALLTFFLEFESMSGSRIGLCAAAVFAAIGNKYALDNYLPPATDFTLADVIVTSSFVSILLAVLAIVVLQATSKMHPRVSRTANFIIGLITVAGYLGVNGYMIAQAVA